MNAPLWLICIPTVPARAEKLERLLLGQQRWMELDTEHMEPVHREGGNLLGQVGEWAGAVRVMGWLNVGTPRLAEIRDAMVDAAAEMGAEYVSFVDDDDELPEYFVAEMVKAMNMPVWVEGEPAWPDHIGFRMDYFKDGVFRCQVEHSLRWPSWRTIRDLSQPARYRLVRDFTHIDPIRTRLIVESGARFASARPHAPEDREWCRQLRPRLNRRNATEAFIDRAMYRYMWAPEHSAWDSAAKLAGLNALFPGGLCRRLAEHPHFTWHKESL